MCNHKPRLVSWIFGALAAACLCTAVTAHATPITFEFTGVITGLEQATSQQWLGSSISGTIVMDLSDPSLQVLAEPYGSIYAKNVSNPSTGWLQVDVRNPDGTHFVIDQPDPLVANDVDGAYTELYDEPSGDVPGPLQGDMFSVFRWTNSNPNPHAFVFQLGSFDPNGSGLASSSNYFDVQFDVTQANFINQGQVLLWLGMDVYDGYTFTVTDLGRSMQVVPEPATLSIFIVGLLGLAFRRLSHRPRTPASMRAGEDAVRLEFGAARSALSD